MLCVCKGDLQLRWTSHHLNEAVQQRILIGRATNVPMCCRDGGLKRAKVKDTFKEEQQKLYSKMLVGTQEDRSRSWRELRSGGLNPTPCWGTSGSTVSQLTLVEAWTPDVSSCSIRLSQSLPRPPRHVQFASLLRVIRSPLAFPGAARLEAWLALAWKQSAHSKGATSSFESVFRWENLVLFSLAIFCLCPMSFFFFF